MPRVECKQCRRLGCSADKCPFKKDVNAVTEAMCVTNLYERIISVNGHKIKGLIKVAVAEVVIFTAKVCGRKI